MNKPIIAIAGPTASGKSAVALALAKKVGGQIVSADSVQVYKRLDIGSAKPTAEEQKEVPHWLIDILDPWENYSAARFCDAAIDAINKIRAIGDVPILCGGTGFYLRSVLYDLDFGAVPPNEALRAELSQLDSQTLYQKLCGLSPDEGAKLHPNDRKRVIRAIEIAQSGAEKGAFRTQKKRFDFFQFCLTMPRETLYQRIDARVDAMMQAGFLKEVQELLADPKISPTDASMQSIGYKQLCAFCSGECSLEEAVFQIKQQTRRFAKRQLTWFRHESDVLMLDMARLETAEHAADEIIHIANL